MIKKLNSYEIEKFSEDISHHLKHFTNTSERIAGLISDLKIYVEKGNAAIFGHVIENELVSFVWSYERHFGGEKRLHIAYFIVDERYRGKGYSGELIETIKSEAEKKDVVKLDLNVAPNNSRAIKMYKSYGFDVEKLQMKLELKEAD